MIARSATAEDAAELVRLRAVMMRSIGRSSWNDEWREPASEVLRRRLAAPEPTMAGFVVDRPGGGLAACVLGTIEERLGGPDYPGCLAGYVFNVATDPDQRRRGHSRLCMTALIDWFRGRGVHRVDLRASPDGEPLYQSLGFVRTADPAMRLRLS
jgi:GNAT superfamily N-acetyltransferase